ncbi:DUF7009 family protein [Reichenbachiella ulvae]|uniref:Uncharacterized protein n=1 Tax=Reichenbachiella ulvae TaxID=2980104 RepID=A0ABT3CQP1_9BACT|nr:hypothetical protein [Reichenbachiella ulvae]MCV9385964.1 hypothetical protein [Reichenbachiella ulvae]
MKIRIQQNCIRIRLSDEDMILLNDINEVTESLCLTKNNVYQYTLRLSDQNYIETGLNSMTVLANKEDFNQPDDVSVKWHSEYGIKVLIESDLHE